MKKIFFVLMCLTLMNTAQAFEDCVITTDGKLTDIKIENHQIIDVYPLITVMNEKNTLIIRPLKEGQTSFSVLKNGKERFSFNVEATKDKTSVSEVEGFDILQIDEPPKVYEYDLDMPPIGKE